MEGAIAYEYHQRRKCSDMPLHVFNHCNKEIPGGSTGRHSIVRLCKERDKFNHLDVEAGV